MDQQEFDQTQFIHLYGNEIHTLARKARGRLINSEKRLWLVNSQKEYVAFENATSRWKKDYRGSAYQKQLLDAFIKNTLETFSEFLQQAMDEEDARQNATGEDFADHLRMIKEQHTVPNKPEPVQTVVPEKPELKFLTVEDVGAEILRRNPEFGNNLVKRSNQVINDVMAAINSHTDAKESVKILDAVIRKLRVDLWNEVRNIKDESDIHAVREWVKTTSDGFSHYAATVLSGVSQNRLDPKQSKIFENAIKTIRNQFLQDITAMNTNAQTTNTESINANEKTEMNNTQTTVDETITNATVANDETAQVDQETTDQTTEKTAEETTETKKPGVFQRVKDRVKAIDWSSAAKYAKYALYFVAVVAVLVGALFGLKHFTASESIVEALKKTLSSSKEVIVNIFKKIGDFFKSTKVESEIPQPQAA